MIDGERDFPDYGHHGRAPDVAPSATAILHGRMLLQCSPARAGWVADQIDADHGGLVLTGPKGLAKAKRMRADGYSGVLLTDPAVYESENATAEDPFPIATPGELAFENHLHLALTEQIGHEATVAMTPTGFIQAEDSKALLAVCRAGAELDDQRVLVSIPADVAWLHDDNVDQFIAALCLIPGVKVLMLGGQMDPLSRFKAAPRNLCRVMAEVPKIALFRTDLAAFGAFAHGAQFTAFGLSGTQRHIVPPPQSTDSSPFAGKSPHVIYPELMALFLGHKIAEKHAAGTAPACGCGAGDYHRLDSFSTNKELTAAAAHNAAVLAGWFRQMLDQRPGAERRLWWSKTCQDAIARYDIVNAAIDQPRAFTPPIQLKLWAGLLEDGAA